MTSGKLNLKTYQNKPRIYRPVAGAVNISRLFVWSDDKGEYLAPLRGRIYLARRYEKSALGRKVRITQYFESLDDARSWQGHVELRTETASRVPKAKAKPKGPTFFVVCKEWQERKYPTLAVGTRVHYDQLLRQHFGPLMEMGIHEIVPSVVDSWIAGLKKRLGKTHQSRQRKSFQHELTLLGVILRYYGEYHEDPEFRYPVKRRHREDAKLRITGDEKPKDLSLEEFLKFRRFLESGAHGKTMAVLATVQFFQALRVSEVAALHWEDVLLNFKSPVESRLRIVRHVEFSRKAGMPSKISPGFKNSYATGGSKELPLFPEPYDALKALYYVGAKGLVFQNRGKFFEYRHVQRAYNEAFKAAGLPYRSTHVMRHGGCRRVYNETGDLGLAAQILGNVSPDTVNVYAKRHKSALTNYAKEKWQKDAAATPLASAGWSQLVADSVEAL